MAKGLIEFYYYHIRTIIRKLRCGCYRRECKNGIVLMFHDLSAEKTDTSKYTVNISDFEEYIMKLAEKKTPVDINNILEGHNGFAITFDDAFESVYVHAYPFLKAHNIPFTVFMSSSFVDKNGYLTKEQILTLDKEPLCTIGAHTVSHPLLRKSKNAFEEILFGKEQLEAFLGHPITHFAYPYGSIMACSHKNKRQAREAGFPHAFSAVPGYYNTYARKQTYFLPRFNGDVCVSNALFLNSK